MKYLFILILFFSSDAYSQQNLNIPQMTSGMPSWAKLMYESNINLIKLDSAYRAFYKFNNFVKSNYTRYYKRLIMNNRNFMNNDGTFNSYSSDVIEKMFQKEDHKQSKSLLGELVWKPFIMETFFLEKNRVACPWQTNVYAIDVSKSNPNILVCAAETGSIYRTTDKGLNWNQIGTDFSLSTEAICIHPSNPDIIYIGTNGSLRKSLDAGLTWKTIHSVTDIYFYDIEINSSNPNIIVTGTDRGLFRSSDGGETWKGISNLSVCEIESNPSNPNVIYIMQASKSGYEPWKSIDGGATFSLKNSGWYNLTDAGVRMSVTPADPKRVYAISLTSKGPHLMRSNDEGDTWKIISTGSYNLLDDNKKPIKSYNGVDDSVYKSKDFPMDNWQGYYDLSLVVSHTNPDQIITGTGSTYKSIDGGKTFVVMGGYGGSFSVHPDLQEAISIGKDTWIATDGGITYSSDFFTDTKNSEARMKGVNGSDVWGLDAGWKEIFFVGGRYQNGNTVWHENYLNKFIRMGGAESATGYVNPIRNRDVYFSDIGGYTMPEKYDTSWQWIRIPCAKWPNETYYPMEHSDMVWSPICYSTVYLGNKNVLWKSTNNGVSFDSVFATPHKENNDVVEAIEISRNDPNVIYITEKSNSVNDGFLWKSINSGKSFILLPQPIGTSNGERRLCAIALSGNSENEIWRAFRSGSSSNKVFHSIDGGKSWTNITTATIRNFTISDITHQIGTDGGVYISCDGGRIFYKNNIMKDWVDFGSGLGVSHFTRGLKIFYRDGKIRSGSNTGVWERPLYEESEVLAQPTADKLTTDCPRDTFYFDNYSVLKLDSLTSWKWEFKGAQFVSNYNIRNPKVIFGKPGKYSVKLTVTNSKGSNSKLVDNIIEVLPSQCEIDSFAGKALDLSNKNDYGKLEAIPDLKNAKGFSCSAWIKLNSPQDCFTQILSNWSSNVSMGFGFAFQGYRTTTNLTFSWKGVAYQLTSAFNLDTSKWIHVAMVVYPDSVRLYRDGDSWTYKGNFKDFDLSSTPWELGQGVPGQCGNFQGQLDELKIYNRSISQNEVRANMHLIHPESEPGLVAYYQFNESPANIYYNRVGSLHGTNGGALRIISTAPVATGKSYKASNISQGKNIFDSTGINLYSNQPSQTGSEIIAYRLFSQPDSLPKNIKSHSNNYWIIKSWGNKSSIPYSSIEFKDLGEIINDDVLNPNTFKLYKRDVANEHLSTWKLISSGVNADSLLRSVKFSGDSNIVGQYIIETLGNSVLSIDNEKINSKFLSVLPNPSSNTCLVKYSGIAKFNQLKIYDVTGKIVFEKLITNSDELVIDIEFLTKGVYYLDAANERIMIVKN